MKSLLVLMTIALMLTISSKFLSSRAASASNYSQDKDISAVEYALGSDGGNRLRNDEDYKKPQIIDNLSKYELGKVPTNNETVVPEEIAGTFEYYNGGNKLNKVQVECRLFSNPTDCLRTSYCGWCGQTNGCVAGTQLGPSQPCLKSTYTFGSPIQPLNPLGRDSRSDVNSITVTPWNGINTK